MRLFQAALDTCLDSPFFASLSVHGLHFTVYAPSTNAVLAGGKVFPPKVLQIFPSRNSNYISPKNFKMHFCGHGNPNVQGKVKFQSFSGSDLLTRMLPTFSPPTIWAISLEFYRKLSILAADDFLGACYRKAMTPKKLWTLFFSKRQKSTEHAHREIWPTNSLAKFDPRTLTWECTRWCPRKCPRKLRNSLIVKRTTGSPQRLPRECSRESWQCSRKMCTKVCSVNFRMFYFHMLCFLPTFTDGERTTEINLHFWVGGGSREGNCPKPCLLFLGEKATTIKFWLWKFDCREFFVVIAQSPIHSLQEVIHAATDCRTRRAISLRSWAVSPSVLDLSDQSLSGHYSRDQSEY